MLSIPITKIGLFAQDQNLLMNKNLIMFSSTIRFFFQRYLPAIDVMSTKAKNLFPKIDRLNVSDLSNSIKGLAIACAADDLELSLNGENGQIEIFDSFVPTNPQQFYFDQMQFGNGKNSINSVHFPAFDKPGLSDLSLSYQSSQFEIDDYSPNLFSSIQSQGARNLSRHSQHNILHTELPLLQPTNNVYPELKNDFAGSHHSYFDIMSRGVQLDTHFTDFKHDSFQDGLNDGSSIESSNSPLDEMFFSRQSAVYADENVKSVNSRKRKLEASVTDLESLPESIVYTRDPSEYQDQKKMKGESTTELDMSQPGEVSTPGMFFRSLNSALPLVPQVNTVKIEEDEKDKARYKCSECDAAFKVKSYLTRHLRKHNNAKAFVCPFYREQDSEYCGTGKSGTKCHLTGGFSRKDTYKTHLKALHFIYPPRTKSSERGFQGGRCAGCFQYFDSNSDWFKFHIENGSCKGFANGSHVQVKQEMQD